MRLLIGMTIALAALPALAQDPAAQLGETAAQPAQPDGDGLHPRVKLETSLGDIVLELDAGKAPITVDNFIQYVKADHYDGLIFHRVMPDFMIQGGGYTSEMDERKEGLRSPIRNEWDNGLKNERGTIAMARTGDPHSATAQFFINVVDNERLSQPSPQTGGAGYAVFGKVVEGMDVVDKIRNTPTTSHPKLPMGDVVPAEPVIIKNAEVIGGYDEAKVKEMIEKADQVRAEQGAQAAEAAKARWPDDVKAFVARTEEELGQKVQVEPSGLAYFVLQEGSGAKAGAQGTAMTHYTGWLIDGTKFDSSVDRGQPFPVQLARPRVIKGWVLALRDMQAGEKRKLILPPHLAYGERGSPPKIPSDAYLVFDVELMQIK